MPQPDNNLKARVTGLVDQLRSSQQGGKPWQSAVEGLASLGYESIPYLLESLAERQLSVYVGISKALRQIGPVGIHDLIGELKSGDNHTRAIAAGILSGYLQTDEAGAEDAVQALINALDDKDTFVRQQAATALALSRSNTEQATAPLIRALKDEDYAVREWAARALGSIGPTAKEAIPFLTELLLDEVPPVRDAASDALDSIGPGEH